MRGIDINRFVELSDREKEDFCCGICHNIFDNAINASNCGHTFCKQCIEDSIESKIESCPVCRVDFRRQTFEDTDKTNFVVISGFLFTANFVLNSMIGKLKIKCKFEFNGCDQMIEYGLLSTHLNQCEHRKCQLCRSDILSPEEHTYIQNLNKFVKYNESEQRIESLYRIAVNAGNYRISYRIAFRDCDLTEDYEMVLNIYGFEFTMDPIFNIDFISIQHLMYSSDRSLPLLFIEGVFPKNVFNILSLIHIGDKMHRNLVIEFLTPPPADFWTTLLLFAFKANPELDCESIDKTVANDMLETAYLDI